MSEKDFEINLKAIIEKNVADVKKQSIKEKIKEETELKEEIEKNDLTEVRRINNDLHPVDIDFDNDEDRRDFIEDIKKELEANLQIGLKQGYQKAIQKALEIIKEWANKEDLGIRKQLSEELTQKLNQVKEK